MPAPIPLTHDLLEQLRAAAQVAYPRECCGLVLRVPDAEGLHYWPCRNILSPGEAQDRFELDRNDYVAAAERGEVVAVVHSHPNASAHPSMVDRLGCERSGLPWLIVGWPSGVVIQIQPEGWEAPLVEREWGGIGVMDCYTLIQDYYRRELGIVLPDFERTDDFWVRGENLYFDHLDEAGFDLASGEPRKHDMLLMQVNSDKVANHAAVYLGDGRMLHHLYGRLSERTVYGGYWARHTLGIARHRLARGRS